MKQRAILTKSRCVNGMALLLLLVMMTAAAQPTVIPSEPAGQVFKMKEVSVFDRGLHLFPQGAKECGAEPSKEVKAYPEFKSEKPFYGKTTFDESVVRYGIGIDYCFALDESGGTGTGYDRLYFDANHDLDLTNDGVLSPMENPPVQSVRMNQPNSKDVTFEYLEFALDRGPAKLPVPLKVIPQSIMCLTYLPEASRINPKSTMWSEHPRISFTLPTVRRGTIRIGSQKFEAVLSQSTTITGSYSSPTTRLEMDHRRHNTRYLLCRWHYVDGTFYILSSTPSGDKLTVTPYTGPFGVLEVGTEGRNVKEGKVESGHLVSKDALINVGRCPRVDGKLRIPVGDYRPLYLDLRLGDLSFGLCTTLAKVEEAPSDPPKFPIRIRQDKPCVINLSSKPKIVFRKPDAGQRFKVDSEIRVKPLIHDPAMDASIFKLLDTRREIRQDRNALEILWDVDQRIEPTVEFTNSSGEHVAWGKIPPITFSGAHIWQVPKALKLNGDEEKFNIIVRFDTLELYGKLAAKHQIIIYRE
ncbi:MAG: hypothetical protein GY774_41510 [Planctomycetes bacterium]|nr:hypothetical protein [Planctomycetota bacterium]